MPGVKSLVINRKVFYLFLDPKKWHRLDSWTGAQIGPDSCRGRRVFQTWGEESPRFRSQLQLLPIYGHYRSYLSSKSQILSICTDLAQVFGKRYSPFILSILTWSHPLVQPPIRHRLDTQWPGSPASLGSCHRADPPAGSPWSLSLILHSAAFRIFLVFVFWL